MSDVLFALNILISDIKLQKITYPIATKHSSDVAMPINECYFFVWGFKSSYVIPVQFNCFVSVGQTARTELLAL